MKLIIKTITIIGIASFLTACSEKSIPLNKQERVVKQLGEHYYYVPVGSSGGKLSKKWAYFNGITSSGLLECKENDVWIATPEAKEQSNQAQDKYMKSLTVTEFKEIQTHPTSIPKRNSKEMLNFIKVETELARTGQSYCLSPMSEKEVTKYKEYVAQQERINNDPRVVAARIEAASRRNAAYQQAEAIRANARAIQGATTQRMIESYTPKTNYNYNYNYNY